MWTLSVSGHEKMMMKEMMKLFREQCLVDCILAAEGKYIKAHSVVLSACSPFFKLLLSEEKRNEPIIILRGVAYRDLVNIVEFIYKGSIQIPDEERSSFLSTAQYLQITGLVELTEVSISCSENITRFEESDNERTVDISPHRLERNDDRFFNEVEMDAPGSTFTLEPSESGATSCSSVETRSHSTQEDEPTAIPIVPNDLERSLDYQGDGSGPIWEQQDQRELEEVQSHCLSNIDSNKENNECHVVYSQHLTQVDVGEEEMDRTSARSVEVMSPPAGIKSYRCEKRSKTCVVGGSNGQHKSSQNTVLKSMASQNGIEARTHSTMSPTQAASGNQEVENRITEGHKNLKRKEIQDILEMDVCEESDKPGDQTMKPPKIYKCKYLAHAPAQDCPMHSVTKHPFSTPNEKRMDAEKGEKCSETSKNLCVRLVRLQHLDCSGKPCFAAAPVSREVHEEKEPGKSQRNTAVEEDPDPSPSSASAAEEEGDLSIGRKCLVCSRIFRGALHLSNHMLNHTPEEILSQSRTASSTMADQQVVVPRQMKRRIKQNKHLCCQGH